MAIQYNRVNILVNGQTYNQNGPGYVQTVDISMDAGATWVDGMSQDYTALALHGNIHPILRISEFLTADSVPISWLSFDWASSKIDFQIIPAMSSAIGGNAYGSTTTMLILPNLFWTGQSYAWDVTAPSTTNNIFYIQAIPVWITL